MFGDDVDPFRYKREGHLQLKIGKLLQFALEHKGRRFSAPVHVLGLQWRIQAQSEGKPLEKYLGFFLQCDGNDNADSDWACSVSATFKLLAQKEGRQDDLRKTIHVFISKGIVYGWGWAQFMSFEELMKLNSDWYDASNDSIVLSMDFKAEMQGISKNCFMAKKDVLSVNGVEVKVNKHHLAANSDYFERFFFGEGYKENSELVLDPPATVEHFKRLIDSLNPLNRPLDDKCIEGVFHLANQFFMPEVEDKCRTFLAKESKRSAIFKYRLADKYGFDSLKKQILASKKEDFFKDGHFFENLNEFAKLDELAREALNARIGQLFGQEMAK